MNLTFFYLFNRIVFEKNLDSRQLIGLVRKDLHFSITTGKIKGLINLDPKNMETERYTSILP